MRATFHLGQSSIESCATPLGYRLNGRNLVLTSVCGHAQLLTRRKSGQAGSVWCILPWSAAGRCLDGRGKAGLGEAACGSRASFWRGNARPRPIRPRRLPHRQTDRPAFGPAGGRYRYSAQPGHRRRGTHHHSQGRRLPLHRSRSRRVHHRGRQRTTRPRQARWHRGLRRPRSARAGSNAV